MVIGRNFEGSIWEKCYHMGWPGVPHPTYYLVGSGVAGSRRAIDVPLNPEAVALVTTWGNGFGGLIVTSTGRPHPPRLVLSLPFPFH